MRYFTLKEANDFVPALSAAFAGISRLRLKILRLTFELSDLGASTDLDQPLDRATPEPVANRRHQIDEAVKKIRTTISELEAHGVIVKELDGHVDFRSLRGQRPVFLSWHRGEDQVQEWHEAWTDAAQPVDTHFPKPLLN